MDDLDKKITHYENKVKDLEKKARESGTRTKAAKQKSMEIMRQRKVCLGHIQTFRLHKSNLESQYFALDSVTVTSRTVDAMAHANKVMEKTINIDEAQDVMDGVHDTQASLKELTDVMGEQVGPQMDEDEFAQEWADFMADQDVEASDPVAGLDFPEPGQGELNPMLDLPEPGTREPTREEQDAEALGAFFS
jgi:hypothetical protein